MCASCGLASWFVALVPAAVERSGTSLTHCHHGLVPTTQGACATATKETAAAYLKLIDEGTGMCDIRGRAVRV